MNSRGSILSIVIIGLGFWTVIIGGVSFSLLTYQKIISSQFELAQAELIAQSGPAIIAAYTDQIPIRQDTATDTEMKLSLVSGQFPGFSIPIDLNNQLTLWQFEIKNETAFFCLAQVNENAKSVWKFTVNADSTPLKFTRWEKL